MAEARHPPIPGAQGQLRLSRCTSRDSGATGVVDPAVAAPVLEAARGDGLAPYPYPQHPSPSRPHRRQSETQGRDAAASSSARAPIATAFPLIDIAVGDGDTYAFGDAAARVFDVPGHTRGHIAFWFSAIRMRSSAATRCSSWAAAASSKARRRRCGIRSASSRRCRRRPGSIAGMSTLRPMRASR